MTSCHAADVHSYARINFAEQVGAGIGDYPPACAPVRICMRGQIWTLETGPKRKCSKAGVSNDARLILHHQRHFFVLETRVGKSVNIQRNKATDETA